jgi:hypothetical protein
MLYNLAVTKFTIDTRQQPDNIRHLGSYPEEEPTHHIFEISSGEISKTYLVQVGESSLIAAEIDSEQVQQIKELKPGELSQ